MECCYENSFVFVFNSFSGSSMSTYLFMATHTSLLHMNMREGFISILVQPLEHIIHYKGRNKSKIYIWYLQAMIISINCHKEKQAFLATKFAENFFIWWSVLSGHAVVS